MEEPLDSFEETPKQDKMISLIAWVIVASLLFYLTVITFEGFLRLSPEIKVVETADSIDGNDSFAQGHSFDVSQGTQDGFQTEGEVFNQANEDVVILPEVNLETTEATVPVVDEMQPEVAETPVVENPVIEQVEVEPTITEDSAELNVASMIEEVVQPETAMAVEVFQLKVNQVFTTRQNAFTFLRAMDFGELDLDIEIIARSDGYHVFLGGQVPRSELNKLDQYLKVRNHGIQLSTVGSEDKENILSGQIESKAPDLLKPVATVSGLKQEAIPASLNGEDFFSIAKTHPFTIQVGSFLKVENAQALAQSLRSKSYTSEVESTEQAGTKHFRVLVGHFKDRRSAGKEATKLSEVEGLPVYVRLAL